MMELAKPNYQKLLQQEYPEIYSQTQKFLAEIQEDPKRSGFQWPDIVSPTLIKFKKADLVAQISSAMTGMLKAEAYAVNHAAVKPQYSSLTQADYIQLPLLIKEAFVHGVSTRDILDGWNTWIADDTAPEKLIYAAVKDGCSIEKIGAYQAYAQHAMHIINRCICWALPCAGNPGLAAKYAYLDAYTSARGEILDAAIFFTATAARAFLLPPQMAVQKSLYDMPMSFIQKVKANSTPCEMTVNATPLDQCALFINCVLLSSSYNICIDRLTKAKADPALFIAAGFLYHAGDVTPSNHEHDRIETKLKYSRVFSKQNAAERFASFNPAFQKKKYVWR